MGARVQPQHCVYLYSVHGIQIITRRSRRRLRTHKIIQVKMQMKFFIFYSAINVGFAWYMFGREREKNKAKDISHKRNRMCVSVWVCVHRKENVFDSNRAQQHDLQSTIKTTIDEINHNKSWPIRNVARARKKTASKTVQMEWCTLCNAHIKQKHTQKAKQEALVRQSRWQSQQIGWPNENGWKLV